jgi:hypothetical protein
MKGTRSGRSDLPTGDVTFLFTDIEGSTRLLVELGEAYEPLLATHAATLRRAFEDHRGVEVNTEGDAFFVAFASAADAVASAVDAQRGPAREPWPGGHEIRVRMGLHTGEGRLGGDDYAGIDVNRAARIASAAHGGQIVVSDSTAVLADGELSRGLSAGEGSGYSSSVASPWGSTSPRRIAMMTMWARLSAASSPSCTGSAQHAGSVRERVGDRLLERHRCTLGDGLGVVAFGEPGTSRMGAACSSHHTTRATPRLARRCRTARG